MKIEKTAKRVALVTGANRGLGLETSRQIARKGYHVVMGGRDLDAIRKACEQLRSEQLDVSYVQLDVTQDASVAAAEAHLKREFGRLDALVNNAGVFLDGKGSDDENHASALKVPVETLQRTLETNLYGPYRMCQRFAALMIQTAQKPDGLCRVVNVSSGMGQLSEMNGYYPGYRFSKTALNALTRVFAEELGAHGILVNSVCPGWVRTDMGGPGAELTPEQGADTIAWAATLPSGAAPNSTGSFFREREQIEW